MGFYFDINSITPSKSDGGGGGGTGVIGSLNVTPTTSQQTFNSSSVDGYKPVRVAAVTAAIDENIMAENIVSGKSILGVNGSAIKLKGETRTETLTSSAGNTFTPSDGKNAITSITVTPNNEARSVTPTTSAQTLNVNNGYSGNGTISISAVTSSIDANILPENIKKDVTILSVTGTYDVTPPTPAGKYQLFDRIKDEITDDEIGTVCGFFHDANDIEYAVVVLDAKFRSTDLKYCSLARGVTDLPVYSGNGDFIKLITNVYTNTATYNCDKLKAYCTSKGETSTALDWCRYFYFNIDNVTYFGQIPNIYELFQIALNHERLGALDPSEELSDYTLTTFPSGRNIVGSDQGDGDTKCGVLYCPGGVINWNMTKTTNAFVYPVLEIPNALS